MTLLWNLDVEWVASHALIWAYLWVHRLSLLTVWNGVKERFCRRFAMWKRQYISKGGRTTLIQSTLSNLPIYFMSLLRMPSSIKQRLEHIQRGFL